MSTKLKPMATRMRKWRDAYNMGWNAAPNHLRLDYALEAVAQSAIDSDLVRMKMEQALIRIIGTPGNRDHRDVALNVLTELGLYPISQKKG